MKTRMSDHPTLLLARKELRDALRNRWFLLYSLAFALIALTLSKLSLGSSSAGFAGFGRTAAGLVNLVLLIVPLMGLTLGAASLAGERERGTLATLLSQPITRREILLGKYLGLGIALSAALLLGFGLAGMAVAAGGGGVDVGAYGRLIAFTLLLALATLSVGFLISANSKQVGAATGVALFAWLGLVFLGDLGIMGTSLSLRLDVQTLLWLTALNPLDAFKIAAVGAITGGLDVLGPAGTYATRTYGSALIPILAGLLVAWAALPLLASVWIFEERSVA